MAALLEVDGLKAFYGQTQALHDVAFSLEDGGITTLLGANGAGKTTTLRAICGMVSRSGAVRLAGRSIADMATEDIVRLGVAHVPEGRGTFTARLDHYEDVPSHLAEKVIAEHRKTVEAGHGGH